MYFIVKEADYGLSSLSEGRTDEVWKDIDGYDGRYQVSNKGRVKSKERFNKFKGNGGKEVVRKFTEKYLKGTSKKEGSNVYIILSHVVDGKQIMSRKMLGQLVAIAFVDNPDPENFKYVKHIDGDQKNNNAENLQWVAWKDTGTGLPKRPVMCVTDGTEYESVTECCRLRNIHRATLIQHLKSGKPFNGYTYRYLDD